MLKRLTLRPFILFMLCVGLTAVSFTPASSTQASSTRLGIFCMDAPLEYGCNTTRVCCDDWGHCWCAD